MSNEVTAKVRCNSIEKWSPVDDVYAVAFGPDYGEAGNEKNKAWAYATPSLSLTMTVKDGSLFEQGKSYTLTFTPED